MQGRHLGEKKITGSTFGRIQGGLLGEIVSSKKEKGKGDMAKNGSHENWPERIFWENG